MEERGVKLVLGHKLLFLFKFRLLQQNVIGVKSTCSLGRHVFFMDVDNVNPLYLLKGLKNISKEFDMADIYVVESSEHKYHTIELVPRSFGTNIDILRAFDNYMTKKYQMFAIIRDSWVLRSSEKKDAPSPKLVGIVEGNKTREQCQSHAKYIELHFGFKPELLSKCRWKHAIKYDSYPTVSKKEEDLYA